MASSEIRGNDSQEATDMDERSPRRSHRSRVLGAGERDKLLKEARKTNKHVPDYLLGRKFPPPYSSRRRRSRLGRICAAELSS